MKITKINPKTSFLDAFPKITQDYLAVYEAIDDRLVEYDKISNKRFADKRDKVVARELAILLEGQKILFQMAEEHTKFIYGLRDVISEYGNVIEKLSEQLEYLANEFPDKKEAKIFQNQFIELKKEIDSTNSRLETTRKSITDIREEVEPVVKEKDLFEIFIKKMKETVDEEKNDE